MQLPVLCFCQHQKTKLNRFTLVSDGNRKSVGEAKTGIQKVAQFRFNTTVGGLLGSPKAQGLKREWHKGKIIKLLTAIFMPKTLKRREDGSLFARYFNVIDGKFV